MFGNTPAEELGGVSVNLRFPGQYYDQETNLHYNWYRYYDPDLGRYITSDPIGLNAGNNTYNYVNSNPVGGYDTYGLEIIGQWWDEPTASNVQAWACDQNGKNCGSNGSWRKLIILNFRASANLSFSVLCTDTCGGEVRFLSTSHNEKYYPLSIPVKAKNCKMLAGHAKLACQAASLLILMKNINKYKARVLELAVEHFDEIATVFKASVDPNTWCQTVPKALWEPL